MTLMPRCCTPAVSAMACAAPATSSVVAVISSAPAASCSALAAISVLRDERLVERSAELGARMMARMMEMAADHPHVGEVRGRGMMIGMEMVRDRGTREPGPELAGRLVVEGLRRGVLLRGGGIYGNVLSLSPPFVLTDRQADHALDVIGEMLDEMR